jgi:hypothetical protein
MPRGIPKDTDVKILDKLKEISKGIDDLNTKYDKITVSVEDTRKYVDKVLNERGL